VRLGWEQQSAVSNENRRSTLEEQVPPPKLVSVIRVSLGHGFCDSAALGGEQLERRASVRITEVRDIFGALLPLGEPLVIHDLSRGGFGVISPFEFLPDTEHRFAFVLPGGHWVRVNASTTHCERIEDVRGDARYSAGFSFSSASPIDELAIDVLADTAKTYLTRSSAHPSRRI